MAEHKPGQPGQARHGEPVTLATVVESFGPEGLDVWAAPGGLEVPVSGVAVREADDDPPYGADLLLAIGTGGGPYDAGALEALLAAAAAAGAKAVVVRSRNGPPPAVAALAEPYGVALLGLSPELDWAEVIGRLRALLALAAGPRHGHEGVLSRQQDLLSLANTLADLVHGSVMIFTPGQELLAASRLTEGDDDMRRAAVLQQHGPPGYRRRLTQLGVYRRLWSDEGVVDVAAVPELGAGRRLAVAVRAGSENLGSIWVAEGSGRPLADNAASLLAESAPVAAARLLGLDQEELARHRLSEELIGRLLLGEVDPRLAGAHLGIPPDVPAAVIVADFAEEADVSGRTSDRTSTGRSRPAAAPAVAHRVREESLRHLAGYRRQAVATTGPDRALIVLLDAADPDAIRRAAAGMATAVSEAVGVPLRVGIGPSVPHLGELSASRMEAELVVRALRRRGSRGERCAAYDDVRGTANLIVLSETVTADERLQAGPVEQLRAHDRRRGTDYTATLAAYLDAFGDTGSASRALNVHANTLRYRLGRVRELTGLDLTDPHERLSAGIQLFALRSDAHPEAEAGLGVRHE